MQTIQHSQPTIVQTAQVERKEFMQEIQHTMQTTIRTAQNQGKETPCKWIHKHKRHTETNKYLSREIWDYRPGTVKQIIDLHCK